MAARELKPTVQHWAEPARRGLALSLEPPPGVPLVPDPLLTSRNVPGSAQAPRLVESAATQQHPVWGRGLDRMFRGRVGCLSVETKAAPSQDQAALRVPPAEVASVEIRAQPPALDQVLGLDRARTAAAVLQPALDQAQAGELKAAAVLVEAAPAPARPVQAPLLERAQARALAAAPLLQGSL